MMQIHRHNVYAGLFGILTIGCMAAIFMFSMQSADTSSQESHSFYNLFIQWTGADWLSHNAFRKIAHFTEYAALGFCLCGTLYFPRLRAHPVLVFYFSFLYALGDEMHQYFVPERAARAFDVYVDFAGAVCGCLIFLLLLKLVSGSKKQKNQMDRIK